MERAGFRCEYCLVPDFVGGMRYEIDHIISEKHGGSSTEDNLAYCCRFCNSAKGPIISSLSGNPKRLLPLFNPRKDTWADHFRYHEDGIAEAYSLIGEGTIKILNLNDPRMIERRASFIRDGVLQLF